MDEDQVVLACALDAPPAKVWRALTEPDLLAGWLMENDFRAEEGASFAFAPPDAAAPEGAIECQVLELTPERRMRLAWRSAGGRRDANGDVLDSVVSFELQPTQDGGTWLEIVHSGLAVRAQADSTVVPLRRRIPTASTAMRMAA